MQVLEYIQQKLRNSRPDRLIIFRPDMGDNRKPLTINRPDKNSFLAKELYMDKNCPFTEPQVMDCLRQNYKSETIKSHGEWIEIWS